MRASGSRVFGIDVTLVTHHGATYFVPDYAKARPASRRTLNGRAFEPRLHKLVAAHFATAQGSMVHAGTFFGDMLPSFARKVPGTLYAFEPVMENYLLAWSTVRLNNLDNVVLLHAGLGPALGVARVEVGSAHRHRGGKSRLSQTPDVAEDEESQQVSVLPIDALGISDLALLQLDVEGFELLVLQGAEETLKRTQPLVVIEDNRDNCEPFLNGLGYERAGIVARMNTVYRPVGTDLSPEVMSAID